MLAISSTKESNAKKQTEKSTGKKQSSNAKKQSESQTKKFVEQECLFCQEQHLLNVCDKFMKKSTEDRKEFAKLKGLCYACLQLHHISKKCRARAVCRTCSQRHPAALHFGKKDHKIKTEVSTDDDTTALKSIIAHAANSHDVSCGDSTSLILPVYVSFGGDSTDERLVYTLLDVQSHACFISQRTSSELNTSGVKSTIRLSTLSNKVVSDIHETRNSCEPGQHTNTSDS